MNKKFKRDIFERCLSMQGNFSDFQNVSDHYFIEPILEGIPDRVMRFDNKEMIIWAINDYLGLGNNKKIINATIEAAKEYGLATPMGARKLTGTTESHLLLEKKLAEFLQKQKGHLSNYGYLGVMGAISAVTKPGDAILLDSLSHSCMIDGAFLSQARQQSKVYPFKHNDMADLKHQLEMAASESEGGALIVAEGVFSMSGDLANLNDICQLKKDFGARLFLDDAHGFGVMGENGRGTAEHLGCHDEVDIYFGTFAKAFVGIGSILAGDEDIISHISFNARTDLSSKSIPMIVVKTLLATLEEVKKNSLRDKLWHNVKALQTGLVSLGFTLCSLGSPISSIRFSTDTVSLDTCKKILRDLREEFNIFCVSVTYPIAPLGLCLFRLIPMASHTAKDIEQTLAAFSCLNERYNLTQGK